MKSQKCYVIMRNSKIYFRMEDSKIVKEYSFNSIKNYPNIPFYVQFWDDEQNPSKVGEFLRNNLFKNNRLLDKIYSKEMYILLPDDTQMLEMRAVEEFFMQSISPKKVLADFECNYMSYNKLNYICISETCRMLVMTRIKEGAIKAQSFLEKKEYEIEELKRHIRALEGNSNIENVQVYLNGSGLKNYSSLGRVITFESILENFIIKKTQS